MLGNLIYDFGRGGSLCDFLPMLNIAMVGG